MSIFGNTTSHKRHAQVSAHPSSHPFEEETPQRKNSYVLDPLDAPKTIRRNSDYPSDFYLYQFAGAMIEQVRCTGEDGEEIRRPALVARMVLKTEFLEGSMMGAKSLEEMTCSVKDLRTYSDANTGLLGHPDADLIALQLAAYYEKKVASRDRRPEKPIPETDFSHPNAFFHAMNPRVAVGTKS